MDKAKKKFASAIDGLRSLHNRIDVAVDEKIQPEHCCFEKIVRHGFPDDARCLAYDPVQRLLAIGTGHGLVRIIGDVGVDYLLRHESDHPVNHIQFLINEGGLITACGNDIIHLWNYRQKTPEIVHSLQLNKESVTCINLPMGNKWLYVGTDKGNVYFVSVGTFQLSPYIINWNKAIDLSCRVHPGPVRQIAGSPTEPTKLLIAYDKGVLVQWNLVSKEVDRFPLDPPIKCFSWHYEGKLVMTGNVDGSICIYHMKRTGEPQQKTSPHGQGPCRPITIVDWKHNNDGDQLVAFAGGMPTDDGLPVPALTFLRASKSATVLEMDHPILSFVTLPQVPFASCPQQPHALAVLLKGELMVIDLLTAGYPCMESPHAMDLHEVPITCVAYYSDCPSDLIGALTLVGCKQRRKGYSDRPWPVSGGIGRECAAGHQELILTGHKDGTVRFWQASGENLQILYRLKTASHFERLEELEGCEKVSHAVKSIELCVESRLLLVSGVSGQVTLFRFTKSESMNTIAVVQIPLLGASSSNSAGEERAPPPSIPKEIRRQKKVISRDSTHSPDTSDASGDEMQIVPFKVRGAPVKRAAGYQPELACLIPWPSTSQADSVTTTALNSAFGVIALGMSNGLALVDIAQCALIYAWSTSELYGSDPTPAIQLQMGDVPSPSPVELDLNNDDGHISSCSEATSPHQKTPTSPKPGVNVVSLFRRNTTEFAASIRERYREALREHTDRSDTEIGEDALLSPPSRQGRCQSERTGGIMRRLTKKKAAVARSLSFHSQKTSEVFLEISGPLRYSCVSLDESTPLCHLQSPLAERNQLVRLNTDIRQKSFDRRRELFKAHSMVATQSEQSNGGSPRGISFHLHVLLVLLARRDTPRDSPIFNRNREGTGPSPSISSHSLEKLSLAGGESVSSLTFIHSYSRRNDPRTSPCLWVGTSAGASIALNLILPQDRLISTVVIAPSGTVVKLRGQVLYQTFMDQSFCLASGASESYKETSKESKDSGSPEKTVTNRILTKASLSPTYSTSLDLAEDIPQATQFIGYGQLLVIGLFTITLLFFYGKQLNGGLPADHWLSNAGGRYITSLLTAVSLQLSLVLMMLHGVRSQRRSFLLPFIIFASFAVFLAFIQVSSDLVAASQSRVGASSGPQLLSHVIGMCVHVWCVAVVWRCYCYLGDKKVAEQIGEQLQATSLAFAYEYTQPPPYADTIEKSPLTIA
ncbi:hypothetical protein Y032_0399g739 [Ancylostoma ceylanicum]|uniref:Lethal giant larvae homologue 2 domain-containing protein n=1 Tax=Ancylostoma ceylanicum TaxID=53326 RepID=A0A016RRQ1_9BILA|nr:hypothetical protein Y032_0399g739 [Ancylostoma ceylanicum]